VRRELPGNFELDDDPARVDLDAVYDFLSKHAYWAEGRSRELIERLITESQRVVGLYHEGRQIGFSRTVSDGASVTYLADVYVLPEFRGRGLGVELVRESVEAGPYKDTRWMLHTRDAHALYERFGFTRPGERLLERDRR
jgi:ribosomal protein S18 acetylase RimI-like enzyme